MIGNRMLVVCGAFVAWGALQVGSAVIGEALLPSSAEVATAHQPSEDQAQAQAQLKTEMSEDNSRLLRGSSELFVGSVGVIAGVALRRKANK
jgi:hypothetical protein